ncbi:fimbrial protein [Dyella japonica]|uniref:Type 1 fimbria pilin n=1 Tax=Dyella japonica TaxID=231455 RepID=A0ABV2K3R4_9GAMM
MTFKIASHPRRRGIVTRLGLLLWLFIVGAAPVWANCTRITPATPTNGSISLTGTITVGRDVPVGTELYRASYRADPTMQLNCGAGAYSWQFNLGGTLNVDSSWTPPLGAKLYKTSVSGIGVYFWSANAGGPFGLPKSNFDPGTFASASTYTFSPVGGNGGSTVQSVEVSFVRTSGPLGAGPLTPTSIPTVQQGLSSGNFTPVFTAAATGSLVVVAGTCTTPDVTVDLGTHYTTELKGVGPIGQWINVPIALNNCPAFFGQSWQFVNTTTTPTTTTRYSLANNSIQYSVTPTTSIVSGSPGVMALQSGGATGIGIQMGDGKGNPLQYNTKIAPSSLSNLSSTTGSNRQLTLQARYYQTTSTPTAGQANGQATVTLTYL